MSRFGTLIRQEDMVMDDADRWAAQFEDDRARLRAVAYRMLGSHAEAEDAVQETWIRLSGSDPTSIDNLGGWLTTVVARVCLDRLRSRTSRREDPGGDDIVVDLPAAEGEHDPAQQALLAESVGAALLIVLDSLGPAERVAFVLHDVFAVPFDEVADVIGRSPEATRQLASRARRRVQGTTPTSGLDLVRQRTVVDAFLRAARNGDFEGLLRLLDPDVVLRPDAAALRMGSMRETHGAEAVSAMLGSGGAKGARLALVDGVAAMVWAPTGEVRGVVEFTLDGDRIVAMDVTGDADRVAALDIVLV